MRYRELKRCGNQKVSQIGLGCEGFINKSTEEFAKMLHYALDQGVNFMDLYTPNPVFRDNLGKAIAGKRNQIVLQGHICSVWEKDQYLRSRDPKKSKASFEDQLKRLGTDYMDVGMIHYVDGEKDFEEVFHGDIIEYCRQLKKEGKIRSIGVSSHNPLVAKKAVETGDIDVLMFSVNAAYDMQPPGEDCNALWDPENYKNGLTDMNPDRKELYELCERMDVAIDVMKAFGGGDMLDAKLSPFGVAFTEAQCMEYCLTRPGVVSVMAGCHSIEQLQKSLSYLEASREERDYASVLSKMEKFKFQGNCMYCGHCAPCVKGISVADVNKYLNLALAQGEVPETVADHYKLLEHHASECVNCKSCERNCPFGVEVVKRMEKAVEVFGY